MFTLKKSLLLLFFLGTISLSVCKQERDADYEDKGEVEEVKRGIFSLIKGAAKLITKTVAKEAGKTGLELMACKVTNQC
uniref:Esculentin-2ISa n=1 Tax=Odorrana ishikawae TaxID=310659 RepID=ES2IA_ODOIS|nr:RecName: Full=Esculentin-2ISa; Flags: Precursor [Odorrana ishikawae]BAK08583.1 Esculentin-2ISa precursor protein [Odorrana ishikawae]